MGLREGHRGKIPFYSVEILRDLYSHHNYITCYDADNNVNIFC